MQTPEAKCLDCGLSYSDPRFADLVVSPGTWQRICPEGGLLCPCCLIARATKLGIENETAVFRSGPFATEDGDAMVAYFCGDWQTAREIAEECRGATAEIQLLKEHGG